MPVHLRGPLEDAECSLVARPGERPPLHFRLLERHAARLWRGTLADVDPLFPRKALGDPLEERATPEVLVQLPFLELFSMVGRRVDDVRGDKVTNTDVAAADALRPVLSALEHGTRRGGQELPVGREMD